MERETIIYRGRKYNRNPNSERRQHRVYFWRHSRGDKIPIALHRQIWIDNFGEIPEKHHVHHKDGDTFNNEISNLELISSSDHAKEHSRRPERRKMASENAVKNNKKMQEATKIWRSSPEGRAWHSKHIKNSLNKPKIITCFECGKVETRYSATARFCSKKCGNKWAARDFRQKNPGYYNTDENREKQRKRDKKKRLQLEN